MDILKRLMEFDWWIVFLGVVTLMLATKFLWEPVEWFVKKIGLQTRWQKEHEENVKLLKATNKLATDTSTNFTNFKDDYFTEESKFKQKFNNYMNESRSDRKVIHDELFKFSNERIQDRNQTLTMQKEINNSIDCIVKNQNEYDEKIKNLTQVILDKQISDYRWEIINLADKISSGKTVSKECLRHAISTYSKYERIIEENGLTNGEVDLSIEIINDYYRNVLVNGE